MYVSALPVLLFLSSVSCAHLGTVSNEVSNREFLLTNFPVRIIRVLVFSDGHFSGKELTDFLEDRVSPAIEAQVGIRLKVAGTVFTKWTDSSTHGILQQMYFAAKDYQAFDLCIAFTRRTLWENTKLIFLGDTGGEIDDVYRRYIMVKGLNTPLTVHEIFHAFVLEHHHSFFGIMQPMLVPGINSSVYLTPRDRGQVLKYKWRDFNAAVLHLTRPSG